jgi:signal transduction histidine kinase/ActR/RegA family two-component response regulator
MFFVPFKKKVRQTSFTTKIVNYFLLLALINVAIFGGVVYLRARDALQISAFKRLSVAATLKEEEIIRWFEDQQRDFLLITQLPDIQSALKILLNKETANSNYQRADRYLSQYLAKVLKNKPSLKEISILDRSNKIIHSTNQARRGEYEILANITYVEDVKLGDNFAPIFYVSPFTGKPTITLANPIEDRQGKRQGMVLVTLNLERIDNIVRQKTGLDRSAETYLVSSLVSKNAFIARDTKSDRQFPEGISSPGIDAAMRGISGYGLYRNYEGKAVLGVYRWLNDQDLALLVELGQDEAFAPAHQLASTTMTVGLISVLGLLVGVNWLAKQLSLSRQQLENYSHQLEVKAQEAQTANRAKSLFLANMSHELRTPLNAILGFAQLMERGANVTVEQKDSLAIINRSGEHLLNLIDDVLEMSKIEAGKTALFLEAFDLHLLLQTLHEMFQIRAQAKQLSLDFILESDLPQHIITDGRKLRQVLINLLGNAVKFTQTGGVTLRARVETEKNLLLPSPKRDRQSAIVFEVEDTGKGIAPEEIDKLFEPFEQTASGIRSGEGTGLGLAISHQFVTMMGGDIKVSSAIALGSTFCFNIQVTLADPSQVRSQAVKKTVRRIAPGQATYRILVVDNNEANRKLLVKLHDLVGFETRSANNGKEAIALWQAWQPHLIWMDIRMPVMDGYAATQYIKQHSQTSKTVVIALTASIFEEQKAKIIAAGCDDFVGKPFQEQVIFDKIAQHLGVRYIYADSGFSFTSFPTRAQDALTLQDLNDLPDEWLAQLHQAAIQADADFIKGAIAQISAKSPSIAQVLTNLLRNYDFDTIIEIVETSKIKRLKA